MSKEPRLSLQGLKVLQVFAERATEDLSGADIRRETKLASGTLYPLLNRFETAGWLTSRWEEIDPREEGRPRRRLYKITGQGRERAIQELQEIPGAALPQGGLAWNM